MKIFISIIIVGVIAVFLFNCSTNKTTEIKAGGIYSVVNGDGGFSVVKLLVLEEGVAHIRLYKNQFNKRPRQIDINTLTLGTINDPDGFGIGHLPIPERELLSWKPVLLVSTEVKEEELDGYNMWKEEGGGVFNN